jgi:hypothetical protein
MILQKLAKVAVADQREAGAARLTRNQDSSSHLVVVIVVAVVVASGSGLSQMALIIVDTNVLIPYRCMHAAVLLFSLGTAVSCLCAAGAALLLLLAAAC